MKSTNILFVAVVMLSTTVSQVNAQTSASTAKDVKQTIKGVVESVFSVENSASIRLKGSPRMYTIRNLMSLGEKKLLILQDSQVNGVAIQLIVADGNRIVDILK